MALSIRNPKAEKLDKQIAAISGENLTQAIFCALEKQLRDLQFGNDPDVQF
ncbi:MAG: type II toxin-antitoxin system VapB family antitoxin [Desulfohalobiaceae bacterium]|nr:type II toxin-antitoxin system VapB family antitoxin [Desulfohalobiaceae bacterium]